MRELVQQCTRLYEGHKSQAALEQLDDVQWSVEAGKPVDAYVDALLLKIRCLMRMERFREAFSLADTLSTPEPPSYRTADLLRLKGILWQLALRRPDMSILELEYAFGLADDPWDQALISAELAYSWACKNCFNSAFEVIEESYPEADRPPAPIYIYRHGQIALLYRDLLRARGCFEELRNLPDGERLARDGLAFVELAEGNLELAGAHLDVLGPAFPDELWLRRRRLRVLSVIDPEAELALLEEIREASPSSDNALEDRYRIAELHYLYGSQQEAVAHFTALAQEQVDPEIASRAALTLGRLVESGSVDLIGLRGVPFLSSSREPGTAAIELVLRTLGRKVAPEWIGDDVRTLGQAAEFFELAGLRTVRCLGRNEELDLLLGVGAPILIEKDEALELIVGFDRTRQAVQLREPTQFGETFLSAERLVEYLDPGCLAVLPEEASVTVSSHAGLLALDRAPRARGEEGMRAQFELAAERLSGRIEPWVQLLEHDLEQFEWVMGESDVVQQRLESTLERAEQAHPGQPWTLGYRGRFQGLQNELSEAVAAYEGALGQMPHDIGLLLRCGEACRQLNRYEVAERMFWQLLELAPSHIEGNMAIAGLYCDMEDHRMARHFVRVAMELSPRLPYNLLNQGRLREMQGHFEAAADAYEQALVMRRGDPYLLERLGVVLSHQHRFEEAVEHLNRAVRTPPPHSSSRISLADVYLRWGYFQKAIDVCEELLLAEPDHPAGLAILGASQFYLGRESDGLEKLQQALAADEEYPWARRQLALAYQQQGNHQRAVQLLRESVSLDSADLWSQHQLAFSLRETGHAEEAVGELVKACRLTQFSDEHLLSALVSTLKEQGMSAEALAHARQGLVHEDGRVGFARRMVVRLLADEDGWEELGPHVEALLARHPNDPEMLLYQATLAKRSGDEESMEQLVRRALKEDVADEDSHYRMTRLLVELELWDEAQQVFERAPSWDDPYLCFQGLKIYSRHSRYTEICIELSKAGNQSVGGRDYYYLTQVVSYANALGRREEAQQAVAQAIAVQPHDPWAYLLLAQTLYPQGQFDRALAAIDRSRTLGESESYCCWSRIDVLAEAKRWEDLEAVARHLGQLDEGEHRVMASISEAEAVLHLHGEEAFDEVVARVLESDSLSAADLARLSGKAYDAECWKLSRRYVERSLAADPQAELGLYYLGLLKERDGDQAAAQDAYEQLVECQPDSHIGHENLGRLFCRQGRFTEAEGYVRRGVELEPRCSSAWSTLAHWHLVSGDCPGAMPALTRADQLQPNRPNAQIDQALRACLEGDTGSASRLIEGARERTDALGPLWAEEVDWAEQLMAQTDLDPEPEETA